MGLDNRVRSSTLKKIIIDIKINHIRNGKKPPSEEKIVDMIIKKYNIKHGELVYDKFIRF